MRLLVGWLGIATHALGAALVGFALLAWLQAGAVVPLLLALGLLVVGPLEDWLKGSLRIPGVSQGEVEALVDRATSLALVVLLLAASFLSAAAESR